MSVDDPLQRLDVSMAASSLEPDYVTLRRIERQAMEFVADIQERARRDRVDPPADLVALRTALLAPPPTGPTDFTTVLNTFALAASGTATSSPTAFDHVPSGGLFTSVIATLLAQAANPFTGHAHQAPALVALEQGVLLWLCREFGLPDTAGGLITTGGSMASLTALIAARDDRLDEQTTTGTLYLTAHTHHSLIKAAHAAGIPTMAVRKVPTDTNLRMDLAAADAMIRADRAAGRRPFLIIGNAGTTDTGTIDPLVGVADLAARHHLWFHVDAAYGGAFQLTARGRSRLAGVERADSITVDPHKGFSLPYGTGVLLVARTAPLRRAFSASAPYLLSCAADSRLPNFSDLGIELTREFRGIRLWLPLHVHGTDAFRASLNEKLDLARAAYEELATDPHLDVPWQPDLSLVAFRARNGRTRRLLDRVHATSPVQLSSTTIAGRDFVRLCVLSHRSHAEHVGQALGAIHAAAR